MSLSFLVPAFLAGLAALAIPVIIHLTRRQTKRTQEFPSLMFLARIPHESTSRRRIHRWPLLLLRCAAVAALVFAFSRPFLDSGEASVLTLEGVDREVVILLDRSYSMGYGDRWQRAVQAAREVVDGLRPGDRATLVLFDTGAEVVEESTADPSVLRGALSRVEPAARGTRYAPALQYAQRVLAGSPLSRREVTMISDFQRAAWDAEAGIISQIRMPGGTVITPVSVGTGEVTNVTVASVTFQRSEAAGRERVTATVRLTSQGVGAGTSVPVSLELDGRVLERQTAMLDGTGAATVRFATFTLPESGAVRGSVRIPEDALLADNEHHFVLTRERGIGVLLVNGSGSAADGRVFLERALSIGNSPGFRVTSRSAGQVQATDVATNAVVVLNQAGFPDGEVGRRLRSQLEAGSGLVIVMGDQRGGWDGVLASRPGDVVDLGRTGGTTLGYVDLGHPVFEPFSSPRSGDFTSARVFRYRPMNGSGAQRVLARFGDGGAALVEGSVGQGRVLAWTTAFDDRSSDLALQPVFLPFLHQLVKHAAGYTPPRSASTVGEPLNPAALAQSGEPYTTLVTPSGDRLPIESAVPIPLDEAGFYELRAGRSGSRATPIAVNIDRGEAELASFDPRELVMAVESDGDAAPVTGEYAQMTIQEKERQQNAWWYLVIGALALLAGEAVVANRRGRRG